MKRHPIVEEDIAKIVKDIGKQAKQLAGTTILITGGAGFLGSYFLAVFEKLNRTYLKKHCKVISVDNYVTGGRKNVLGDFSGRSYKFKEYDVSRPLKISGKIDYVIHAAGIASPVYYMERPLETIEVATKGTQNMLELARLKRVKAFVFFSSSEVYGDPYPEHIPTPESYQGLVSTTGPRPCYYESKRLGETLCMVYFRLFGTPIRIIRPFNVYGPGMKPDDHRVIPQFLTSALRGKAIPVYGNGLQTRAYCYVSDAISGFFKVLLAEKNGEVYNIGNQSDEINLITLSRYISGYFNDKLEVRKIPYSIAYPADEPSRRCPDITKAKTALGYHPSVNIKIGLGRLLQWYHDEFFSS